MFLVGFTSVAHSLHTKSMTCGRCSPASEYYFLIIFSLIMRRFRLFEFMNGCNRGRKIRIAMDSLVIRVVLVSHYTVHLFIAAAAAAAATPFAHFFYE